MASSTTQTQTPPPPAVYAAICEVSAALARHGIAKDRKNTQQGYAFRGIDDVYNALAPVIAAARLCILPRVTERTVTEGATKSGGVLFYVVTRVEFDVVSAVDGSKHTVVTYGEAMDSADKATNKAMSAAYKYMAMQLFCIPTEGDNDADAHTPDVAPRREGGADKAARQSTHHPSWEKDQRGFMAALAERGLGYDLAVDYCEHRGFPRPSQMSSENRAKFLDHLASADGKNAMHKMLNPQEGK